MNNKDKIKLRHQFIDYINNSPLKMTASTTAVGYSVMITHSDYTNSYVSIEQIISKSYDSIVRNLSKN